MSALAHEAPCDPGLDEVLWQAWKAMDLPEGYRAEIIEGSIVNRKHERVHVLSDPWRASTRTTVSTPQAELVTLPDSLGAKVTLDVAELLEAGRPPKPEA